MLCDHVAACEARDISEDRCDEDRIVELPRDRNEVRDDVVAEQPLEQDDAIGDEAGDLAGVTSASEQKQHSDQRDPRGDRCAEAYCEPVPGTQAATARP